MHLVEVVDRLYNGMQQSGHNGIQTTAILQKLGSQVAVPQGPYKNLQNEATGCAV